MKSSISLALFLVAGTTHAQNWVRLKPPQNDSISTIYDVVFVNADTGWVAGEYNVRKTTDGGVTWTKQTPDRVTHNLSFMALHFRNADSGWAGGIQGEATIYFTANGGQTWSPGLAPQGNGITTGYYTWGFAFLPSGKGLAAGSRSMGRTTDGRQWAQQPLSPNFRTVDFADSLIAVAAGEDGAMMRTVDGGITWTTLPVLTSSDLLQLRFVTDSLGWCVGGNGTLLRTVDLGATWSLVPTGTEADLWTTFFFDRDTGYVGGEDGLLWKTTNGGTTWTPQATGTSQTITRVHFLAPGQGWAVGLKGLILKTAPDTGAPSGFAYEKGLKQFSPGTRELYPLSPTVSGALPMRYTVTPALPSGLHIDSSTGVLQGTPTQLAAATAYVVEVSNVHGSARDTIHLRVDPPPAGLIYSRNGIPHQDGDTLFLEALVPLTLQPTVTGYVDGYLRGWPRPLGPLRPPVEEYLKNTNYPRIGPGSPPADVWSGLELNPVTGVISGSPGASYTGNHTIEFYAFNNSGAFSKTAFHFVLLPNSGIAHSRTGKNVVLRLPGATFNLHAPPQAVRARIELLDSRGREVGRAGINALGDTHWDSPLRSSTGILVARISWLDAEGRSVRTDRRTIPFLK